MGHLLHILTAAMALSGAALPVLGQRWVGAKCLWHHGTKTATITARIAGRSSPPHAGITRHTFIIQPIRSHRWTHH